MIPLDVAAAFAAGAATVAGFSAGVVITLIRRAPRLEYDRDGVTRQLYVLPGQATPAKVPPATLCGGQPIPVVPIDELFGPDRDAEGRLIDNDDPDAGHALRSYIAGDWITTDLRITPTTTPNVHPGPGRVTIYPLDGPTYPGLDLDTERGPTTHYPPGTPPLIEAEIVEPLPGLAFPRCRYRAMQRRCCQTAGHFGQHRLVAERTLDPTEYHDLDPHRGDDHG